MIENIGQLFINAFFSLATTVIKIILSPIDLIISRFLPSVNNMINNISEFLNIATQYVGWVFDSFGISSDILTLIISLFIIRYSIYFAVYLFKIIYRWVKK